jgi:cell shape-determining protein MreC
VFPTTPRSRETRKQELLSKIGELMLQNQRLRSQNDITQQNSKGVLVNAVVSFCPIKRLCEEREYRV